MMPSSNTALLFRRRAEHIPVTAAYTGEECIY